MEHMGISTCVNQQKTMPGLARCVNRFGPTLIGAATYRDLREKKSNIFPSFDIQIGKSAVQIIPAKSSTCR